MCLLELKLAELRPLSETCDMFQFFFCSESPVDFTSQHALLFVATCVTTKADRFHPSILWITVEQPTKVVFIQSSQNEASELRE